MRPYANHASFSERRWDSRKNARHWERNTRGSRLGCVPCAVLCDIFVCLLEGMCSIMFMLERFRRCPYTEGSAAVNLGSTLLHKPSCVCHDACWARKIKGT